MRLTTKELLTALTEARQALFEFYAGTWECCTVPRTPLSLYPDAHKGDIDADSYDDLCIQAAQIRNIDAILAKAKEPA